MLTGMVSGAMILALGPCTTDDAQAQLANGLRTAFNGMFNIATTAFTNGVFDVDD